MPISLGSYNGQNTNYGFDETPYFGGVGVSYPADSPNITNTSQQTATTKDVLYYIDKGVGIFDDLLDIGKDLGIISKDTATNIDNKVNQVKNDASYQASNWLNQTLGQTQMSKSMMLLIGLVVVVGIVVLVKK